MTSYVSHLEAAIDGTVYPADSLQTTHAGRPLWVRYDLDRIRRERSRDVLRDRELSLWRYHELLPVAEDEPVVTLGEGMTPLLHCERLGAEYGLTNLFIKDDSQLPTGSFKSRGQSLAVTMAKKFGVTRLALPTNGNAGAAMAAYAARAGLESFIFLPEETPLNNIYGCSVAGAHTYLVNGHIHDCGRIIADGMETMNWFDVSAHKEPYRIEGKKTMGLEIAEQFRWRLPDVVLQPTGGGTGILGMWKGFKELSGIGWLDSGNLPRMVAVQSDGCCPIASAFEKGERFAEEYTNAATVAAGIRVPSAMSDFMLLDSIRESRGRALAVNEERILEWMHHAIELEGISLCPEAAACVGAVEALAREGWIRPNDHVVICNTAAAHKYTEAMQSEIPRLDINEPMDYAMLSAATPAGA